MYNALFIIAIVLAILSVRVIAAAIYDRLYIAAHFGPACLKCEYLANLLSVVSTDRLGFPYPSGVGLTHYGRVSLLKCCSYARVLYVYVQRAWMCVITN